MVAAAQNGSFDSIGGMAVWIFSDFGPLGFLSGPAVKLIVWPDPDNSPVRRILLYCSAISMSYIVNSKKYKCANCAYFEKNDFEPCSNIILCHLFPKIPFTSEIFGQIESETESVFHRGLCKNTNKKNRVCHTPQWRATEAVLEGLKINRRLHPDLKCHTR